MPQFLSSWWFRHHIYYYLKWSQILDNMNPRLTFTVCTMALNCFMHTFHKVRSSTCSGIWVESIRRWCKRSRGSAPINICFCTHEDAFLQWWLISPSPEKSESPDKSDKFETVDDTSSFSSAVSILKYYTKFLLVTKIYYWQDVMYLSLWLI